MTAKGSVKRWRWPLATVTLISVLWSVVATGGVASAQSDPIEAPPPRALTTPYTGVVVQAGSTVQLDLEITSPVVESVDLTVEAPTGWETVLRGGGFVITSVTAGPDDPGKATLEVDVPFGAEAGLHDLVVDADFGVETRRLSVSVDVQAEVDAGIGVTVDFPSLEGGPSDTFTYTVTVENNTPQEQTFNFVPTGPQGWSVDASPQAEQQANTVTLAAGASEDVRVTATPAATTPAGDYQVQIEVAAASGASAVGQLTAVVRGTPELSLSTADGRLNADGSAGATSTETLLVTNTGTAPLDGVQFSATPPSDWEVEFEPSSLDSVAPGETVQVQSLITADSDAVAGDYVVSIRATSGTNSDDMEMRYSIGTSSWVGVLAAVVVVVALGLLYVVYRRLGRR